MGSEWSQPNLLGVRSGEHKMAPDSTKFKKESVFTGTRKVIALRERESKVRTVSSFIQTVTM